MHRLLALSITAFAMAACGGGGGGGSSDNDPIDTAARDRSAPLDNAVQAGKYGSLLLSAFDIEAGVSQLTISGREVENLDYTGATITNSTFNCDNGTQILINENGSSLSGESTNGCITDFLGTSTNNRATLTFSGKLAIECTSLSNNDCSEGTATFGEAETLATFRYQENIEGEPADFTDSYTGTTGFTSANGENWDFIHDVTNNLNDIRFGANWQDFSFQTTESGTDVIWNFSGTVGLSSSASNCNAGTVTVGENSTLTQDEDGEFVSGSVSLMNSEGQSASLTLNPDGTITVVANGQQSTLTRQDIEAYCTF